MTAQKQASPHVCYVAEFGHSTSKGVNINIGNPKLGIAGAPPLATGAWPTPKTTPSTYVLAYLAKFVCSASKSIHINRRDPAKLGNAGALSLTVGRVWPLEIRPSPCVLPF